MNKEIVQFAIGLTLTAGILWVFRPRKSKTEVKGFSVPKTAKAEDNEYANAVIALESFRAAINAAESKENLDELNRELLKLYNIRVIEKNGLLTATNRSGKAIAKEQK